MNHVFVWEARKGAATGYVCQLCGMVVSSNDVARVATEVECRQDESTCENGHSHSLGCGGATRTCEALRGL